MKEVDFLEKVCLFGRSVFDLDFGGSVGRFCRRRRRLSVCDVMYCGLTVRSRAKVILTAYREVVYEKPIGTKMNDIDLCLEVV